MSIFDGQHIEQTGSGLLALYEAEVGYVNALEERQSTLKDDLREVEREHSYHHQNAAALADACRAFESFTTRRRLFRESQDAAEAEG